MSKYYEMEVCIRGTVTVPVDDYHEDKEYAIECIEMTDDLIDIAENIERNLDKEWFIFVNKGTVKEIDEED